MEAADSSPTFLRRLRFEHLFIVIFIIALILRFFLLDLKLFHHDEAVHAWFSFKLLTEGAYIYDPVYHGPLLYYTTAGMFALLGDSDLVGRIVPALLGTLMVLLVWPIYRLGYLGKRGALIAALFLAISPNMVYFSRFLRNDIFIAFFSLLFVVAILYYFEYGQRRYMLVAALAAGLGCCSKENMPIILVIFGVFILAAVLLKWVHLKRGWWVDFILGIAVIGAVGALFYSSFGAHPEVLWTGAFDAIEHWTAMSAQQRLGGPPYFYVILLMLYEVPIALLALVGTVQACACIILFRKRRQQASDRLMSVAAAGEADVIPDGTDLCAGGARGDSGDTGEADAMPDEACLYAAGDTGNSADTGDSSDTREANVMPDEPDLYAAGDTGDSADTGEADVIPDGTDLCAGEDTKDFGDTKGIGGTKGEVKSCGMPFLSKVTNAAVAQSDALSADESESKNRPDFEPEPGFSADDDAMETGDGEAAITDENVSVNAASDSFYQAPNRLSGLITRAGNLCSGGNRPGCDRQLGFALFCIWWMGASLVTYAIIGEKVPWLILHQLLPMIFVAAFFMTRKKAMVALVLSVFLVVMVLHVTFTPADINEPIVQVQNSEELRELFCLIDAGNKTAITSEGVWPLPWYYRGDRSQKLAYLSSAADNPEMLADGRYDVVVSHNPDGFSDLPGYVKMDGIRQSYWFSIYDNRHRLPAYYIFRDGKMGSVNWNIFVRPEMAQAADMPVNGTA